MCAGAAATVAGISAAEKARANVTKSITGVSGGLEVLGDALRPKINIPEFPDIPGPIPTDTDDILDPGTIRANRETRRRQLLNARLGTSQLRIPLNTLNIPGSN